MPDSGGVFGKKSQGKEIKQIQAGGDTYTLDGVDWRKGKIVLQSNSILAEHNLQQKESTTKGAFVVTVKKNTDVKYIIGYGRGKNDTTKVAPKVLTPSMTWAGGTESMKISAETLVRGGGKKQYNIWPEITTSCAVFKRARVLKKSIMDGLVANRLVPPHVVDAVGKYFRTGMKKIDLGDMSTGEAKQLAKYGGEVFAGVGALAGKDIFSDTPWTISGNATGNAHFVVPLSPSFAGIDSLIVDDNGELFPVSSKSGKGAAASFVANVLKVGTAHGHCLDGKLFFTKLCKAQEAATGREQQGVRFGFLFLNEVLNIPQSGKTINGEYYKPFENPVEIYDTILGVKDNRADDVATIVKLIEKWNTPNKKVPSPQLNLIQSELPNSIPAFIGRQIAEKIMSEKGSVKQIKAILVGKAFYQFNLDLNKFINRGEVYFKVTSIRGLDFFLEYGKGNVRDPKLGQGFLNYFLK